MSAQHGFCPACGAPLPQGSAFCPKCGRPANGSAAATNEEVELIKPRIRTGIPGFVKGALHPSEVILAAYSASLFDHKGSGLRHDKFALTNERIIYFHNSLVHKGMGEMPYRTITGVSYNKGFRHGKVVVEAANASLTMDGIGNDDAAFAEKIVAGCVAGRRFAVAE